jgi:hypothetical protein
MDALWNNIEKDNHTRVKKMCEKRLQDNLLKRSIEEKIRNKDYEIAGGYVKFQRDVKRLKEDYYSVLREFEENEV